MIAQVTPGPAPISPEKVEEVYRSIFHTMPIATVVLTIFLSGFALGWWTARRDPPGLRELVDYLKQIGRG